MQDVTEAVELLTAMRVMTEKGVITWKEQDAQLNCPSQCHVYNAQGALYADLRLYKGGNRTLTVNWNAERNNDTELRLVRRQGVSKRRLARVSRALVAMQALVKAIRADARPSTQRAARVSSKAKVASKCPF